MRAPGSGAYIGAKNNHRKQFLHEGQIRSFKGDIIPGESFPLLNVECKSYKSFPFHQLFASTCKQLDGWINQLMDVADPDDLNLLIMKFNLVGKFVAYEAKHGDVSSPRGLAYPHPKHGSWIFTGYDDFWAANADAVKILSARR
jgi:hypothetical protein